MFKALTVVPARSAPPPDPDPDVVMRLTAAGALELSSPVMAGRRLIRVENAGAKRYEFQIRRVLPGHTTDEAIAWRPADNPGTGMPYEILGGLSDVPPGESMLTTMTFEPGDYFVGSPMRTPFTVLPEPR